MKKLNLPLLAAAVLFGLSLFVTSCQKEDIVQQTSEVSVQENEDLPELEQGEPEMRIDVISIDHERETDTTISLTVGWSPIDFYIKKDHPKKSDFLTLIAQTDQNTPLKGVFSEYGELMSLETASATEMKVWNTEVEDLRNELESIEDEGVDERYSYSFSSYWQMRSAFNYLDDQGCNNYYTPEVYPCITFRYKADGCYARAHKMKQALENKYGKTCKKIFAYGKLRSGCFRTWKFHVAPLVYVGSTAYVLDPALASYPLTVNQWINKLDPNWYYNVCSYHITWGSRYYPKSRECHNYDYYYDTPTLNHTNYTLLKYKNKTGC